MTRADAMLCVHDVVLGKELRFLCPAPRALRLVQFTLRESFAEASENRFYARWARESCSEVLEVILVDLQ